MVPVSVEFFRKYDVTEGDVRPNTKYVYLVRIAESASELTLYEGQELKAIPLDQALNFKFANVLSKIMSDFIAELGLKS